MRRKRDQPGAEAPWERDNPKDEPGQAHHHLTPAEKATAKRHAKAAGRPYPNLVDNMRVTGKKKSGS